MLNLPRLHGVEIHEQPWCPASLRGDVQRVLSEIARWMRVYDSVIPRIEAWMAALEGREILDLCSGAGGPAVVLLDALHRRGQHLPKVILSDLFPHVDAMHEAKAQFPAQIDVASTPVDATDVPATLCFDGQGKARARSLICCFHHFPPEVAQRMLADAIAHRAPVLILEPISRRVSAMLSVLGAASVLAPLSQLRQARREPTALLRIPLLSSIVALDGITSVMRTYTPDQIKAMVLPLSDDYIWDIGLAPNLGGSTLGKLFPISYALGRPRLLPSDS